MKRILTFLLIALFPAIAAAQSAGSPHFAGLTVDTGINFTGSAAANTLSNLGGVTAAQAAAAAPVQSVAGATGAVTLSGIGLGTANSPLFAGATLGQAGNNQWISTQESIGTAFKLTAGDPNSGFQFSNTPLQVARTNTYTGVQQGIGQVGGVTQGIFHAHQTISGTPADQSSFGLNTFLSDVELWATNNNENENWNFNTRVGFNGSAYAGTMVGIWNAFNQDSAGSDGISGGFSYLQTTVDDPSSVTLTFAAIGSHIADNMVASGNSCLPTNDTVASYTSTTVTLAVAPTCDVALGSVIEIGPNTATTADAPSGNTTLPFADTSQMSAGEIITGAQFPSGEIIVNVNSGTQVTLAYATTADTPSGSVIALGGSTVIAPGAGYALENATTAGYNDNIHGSFTAAFSSGAQTLTITSPTGVLISGMYLNCAGIQPGTRGYISAYPVTSILLSVAATATEGSETCYMSQSGYPIWGSIDGAEYMEDDPTNPPFVNGIVAREIDFGNWLGVTVTGRRTGLQLVLRGTATYQSPIDDAFISMAASSVPAAGLIRTGIGFTPQNSFNGFASNATLLRAAVPNSGATLVPTVTGGLDVSGLGITGNFLRAQGFSVDGSDNIGLQDYFLHPQSDGLVISAGWKLTGVSIASGGTACAAATYNTSCGFHLHDILYGNYGDIWTASTVNTSQVVTAVSTYENAVGYYGGASPPSTETLTNGETSTGIGAVTLNLTWTQAGGGIQLNPGPANVVLGSGTALATTAITGLAQLPTMAGRPTGTATVGDAVIDTTDSEVCFYVAAATWKCAAGS